ncbi:MAG: acetyl-CoA synthetase [Gaiellales bacterium]|nr:acetyl-CoA synthetase [Gaiellales bacterium]
MSEYAWNPPAEWVANAHATALARRLGVEGYGELLALSIAQPEGFWDAVVGDLAIPFHTPYESVLDVSRGPAWARWFAGGKLNLTHACVERWADDAAHAHVEAIAWEDEAGATRSLTYAELAVEVARCAEALEAIGVRSGDAVALLMPMAPEVVVAYYAIASIGALVVPIFSGFSASAVASRLEDSRAVVLITVDAFMRRGRPVPAKATADEAVTRAPGVRSVVVVRHTGEAVEWREGRDLWWHELVEGRPGTRRATPVDSEHPFMLAYTSGTTGRPKGAVHVHGGFLVKIVSEGRYTGDFQPGDRIHWMTDIGWIMGPWLLANAHGLGLTAMLYDGAPDFPDQGRLWRLAERHRLTFLGISPTLIRALRQGGDALLDGVDLSALRTFGSTGEPWNPEPWLWLFERVGGGTKPIMNISGGTEVAAAFLGSPPFMAHKPCTLGVPLLGMAMDVYDAAGEPLRGEVGELVCTQPWPGMTRGIWGDDERYLETYWSRYPGVWTHGDWASIDEDGDWFLHGRSDDTLNVAGKRIGPAEYESALVDDPSVAEACAVGVPHAVKGEVVWCFCVLAPGSEPGEELRARLRQRCAEALGKAFAPAEIRFTTALPKTRSAKILRRAVRATVLGDDPGDLSTLEDPSALDAVRAGA